LHGFGLAVLPADLDRDFHGVDLLLVQVVEEAVEQPANFFLAFGNESDGLSDLGRLTSKVSAQVGAKFRGEGTQHVAWVGRVHGCVSCAFQERGDRQGAFVGCALEAFGLIALQPHGDCFSCHVRSLTQLDIDSIQAMKQTHVGKTPLMELRTQQQSGFALFCARNLMEDH